MEEKIQGRLYVTIFAKVAGRQTETLNGRVEKVRLYAKEAFLVAPSTQPKVAQSPLFDLPESPLLGG